MKIEDIDKNFIQPDADLDTNWIDAKSDCFQIHGVYYDYENNHFVRLPKSIAEETNEGVLRLHSHTAGGRIRFRTNSNHVSVRSVGYTAPMCHMPITGSHGCAIYCNGVFISKVSPTVDSANIIDDVRYTGKIPLPNGEKNIDIYLPLYSCVREFYIGLEDNCIIMPATPFKYNNPIVYYGSSITQGGCASRPGNDYQAYISRWENVDYINLGFSGSAKGEPCMAEYISTLNPKVFVIDYDHNAPTIEHLKSTHYNFYKIIRNNLPKLPIVFVSRPNFYGKETDIERRDIIKSTYIKALEEGDTLVDFVDGESLFGEEDRDSCTVDMLHPNDLGFYRMAKVIHKHLKKYL